MEFYSRIIACRVVFKLHMSQKCWLKDQQYSDSYWRLFCKEISVSLRLLTSPFLLNCPRFCFTQFHSKYLLLATWYQIELDMALVLGQHSGTVVPGLVCWQTSLERAGAMVESLVIVTTAYVEKCWVLTFTPEASSSEVFSDLVKMQGYLKVSTICGLKSLCFFVKTYQLPFVAGCETVYPGWDLAVTCPCPPAHR